MKIEYKFVDGTVTEIEVDGSLGKFMLEMKNEGDRVERKETRRHDRAGRQKRAAGQRHQ